MTTTRETNNELLKQIRRLSRDDQAGALFYAIGYLEGKHGPEVTKALRSALEHMASVR